MDIGKGNNIMRYALKYNPDNSICDVEGGVCYNTFPSIQSAQAYIDNYSGMDEDYSIVELPYNLEPFIPEYTYTEIGRVEMGCDGSDQYFLVSGKTDIIPDDLLEDVEHKFYVETYREAGGYFCKHFTLMKQSSNEYIVRVCHRYDV